MHIKMVLLDISPEGIQLWWDKGSLWGRRKRELQDLFAYLVWLDSEPKH